MTVKIDETHYSILSLVKTGSEYTSAQAEYTAETTASELPDVVMQRAEADIPSTYLGLARDSISLRRVENDVFSILVDYTAREDQTPATQKPGYPTVLIRSADGGTINYKIALDTVRYGSGGLNDAPDTKKVVGLLNGEVLGVDIPEANCELVVEYRIREQGIDTTGAYDVTSITEYIQSLLEAQDKHVVNSDVWKIAGFSDPSGGFAVQTLRFMSFEAVPIRQRDTLTGLGAIYSFSCVFNLSFGKTGLVIDSAAGNITVSAKPGQHYLEVKYTENDIDGDLIEEPKYAYVHKLYEEVNYTNLFKVAAP